MSEEEYESFLKRQKSPVIPPINDIYISPAPVKAQVPKRGKPNKTESEYATRLSYEFPGSNPRFEALTLYLENGHRYTPDWIVRLPDHHILCVEVKARGKNGFRHPSYGRAKLAFDQARIDWPLFTWRWAEKCQGEWTVEEF